MAIKPRGQSSAERECTAFAGDAAIDWEASETDAESYLTEYGTDRLKAKPGESITVFWFKPLKNRVLVEIRSRHGFALDGQTRIGDLEAMSLEAFRLGCTEIEGIWKQKKDEPVPDKWIDDPGLFAAAKYCGAKIIRFNQVDEEESSFL